MDTQKKFMAKCKKVQEKKKKKKKKKKKNGLEKREEDMRVERTNLIMGKISLSEILNAIL